MLKGTRLRKSYGELTVLKGVDIEIKKGEVVSIVGASGAGKSTLLHIIGTLDAPDAGTLEINGKAIYGNGRHNNLLRLGTHTLVSYFNFTISCPNLQRLKT